MKVKYKQSKLILFLDFFMLIILCAADQVTKFLAVERLKNKDSFILIKDVFVLHYLENKGAAFGLLQNQKWFFVIIGVSFVLLAIFALSYIPTYSKYRALRICILLIATGAVGNIIDRVRLNYVIDFLYFSYINFPIFNVADIYVSCGTVLLILLILFYYKEEDLNFKEARMVKLHTSMIKKDEDE